MSDRTGGGVTIIDYGLGNLFSVKHACERVGLQATITHNRHEVLQSGAVILPGVGAFGEAMRALAQLDLVGPLRDAATSGIPFVGICLGMQLLMSESHEFGRHRGLDLIEGEVVRLEDSVEGGRHIKVPQVGWNTIKRAMEYREAEIKNAPARTRTLLDGVPDDAQMYFVHSFYCRPSSPEWVLSTTRYGTVTFCSTLRRENIIGFQYHPERSGPEGLRIYRNLAALLTRLNKGE